VQIPTFGLKTKGTNEMIEEREVGRKLCEGLSTGRYFKDSECLLLILSSDLSPKQYKNAHQKSYNCAVLQYPSE